MEDQPPLGPPPPISSNESHCPQCGQPFVAGTVHCPACGLRLAPGSDPMSVASMVGLGILTLILGGFGTCSLLGGVSVLLSPSGARASLAWFFLTCTLFGAVTLYLAILCVRRVLESMRQRREKP